MKVEALFTIIALCRSLISHLDGNDPSLERAQLRNDAARELELFRSEAELVPRKR